ncbi:hypothetical protein BDZ89DRAFT_1044882 [Hymenopellis radicata]|nr:hypothetical protein BDZ89DRAFT_1044882 [Hymenopellis radicata]
MDHFWNEFGHAEYLAAATHESAVNVLPAQVMELRDGAEADGKSLYGLTVEDVLLAEYLVVREDVLKQMVEEILSSVATVEAWLTRSGWREDALCEPQCRAFQYTKEDSLKLWYRMVGVGARVSGVGRMRRRLARLLAHEKTTVMRMDWFSKCGREKVEEMDDEVQVIMKLRGPTGVLDKEDIYWGLLISGVTQVATGMKHRLTYTCEQHEVDGIMQFMGTLLVDGHEGAVVVCGDKKRVKGYAYRYLMEQREWYWAVPAGWFPQELLDEVIPMACETQTVLGRGVHDLCMDEPRERKKMAQTLMLVGKRWGFAARKILWEKIMVKRADFLQAVDPRLPDVRRPARDMQQAFASNMPFLGSAAIRESIRAIDFWNPVEEKLVDEILRRLPNVRELTFDGDLWENVWSGEGWPRVSDVRVWGLHARGERLDVMTAMAPNVETLSLIGSLFLGETEGPACKVGCLKVALYGPVRISTPATTTLFETRRLEMACNPWLDSAESTTFLLNRVAGVEDLRICFLRFVDTNAMRLGPEMEGSIDMSKQHSLKALTMSFHLMRNGMSAAGTLTMVSALEQLQWLHLEVFVVDGTKVPGQFCRVMDSLRSALGDIASRTLEVNIRWRCVVLRGDEDIIGERRQACHYMSSRAREKWPGRVHETVEEIDAEGVEPWEWAGLYWETA